MSKAIEAKERYDYYAIGLCFAILGASIQTAKFNPHQKLAAILEIISWILFVWAAIKGLIQLKTYSLHFEILDLQSRNSEKITRVQKILNDLDRIGRAAEENSDVIMVYTKEKALAEASVLTEELNTSDEKTKELTNQLENIGTDNYGSIMINAFGLLAIARALEPIKAILSETFGK